MKSLAEKLRTLEREISEEKGAFLLFALFLRDEPEGYWDLLVAAPWAEADKGGTLRLIASRLQPIARPEELAKLSRIVIIESTSPALEAMQSAIHVEHGLAEIRDSMFNGLKVNHAYVVTSQRERTSV